MDLFCWDNLILSAFEPVYWIVSELQQYILGLSVKERLELITFIASSIDPGEAEERLPEQWLNEAKERDAKYLAGKSKTYTWQQIKSDLNGE